MIKYYTYYNLYIINLFENPNPSYEVYRICFLNLTKHLKIIRSWLDQVMPFYTLLPKLNSNLVLKTIYVLLSLKILFGILIFFEDFCPKVFIINLLTHLIHDLVFLKHHIKPNSSFHLDSHYKMEEHLLLIHKVPIQDHNNQQLIHVLIIKSFLELNMNENHKNLCLLFKND